MKYEHSTETLCIIVWFGNLNSEQLVLGLEWKSKIVIFISDEAEKFGDIQHLCPKEKIWLLHILWCPLHKSSEKKPFNWKTMYNRVIANLNSEQLFWAWSGNPKLTIWAFKSQSHSTQYLFNSERVHKFIWWCFLLQNGAQERHPTQKYWFHHSLPKTLNYTWHLPTLLLVKHCQRGLPIEEPL